MDLGLAGRVFVLTGASRGLGFATAQALVADGARVVVSSRNPEQVAAAAAELGGDEQAIGVPADLTGAATPRTLIDAAHQHFGRFDGGLVSVGGPTRGTVAGLTDEQWGEAFETVFLGAIRAMRTFAAALTEGGAVALVLSTSAKSPIPGLGLSNGLRPGLAMAAKDLADQYAPKGVRVLSLLPGRLLTDRNREMFATAPDPAAEAAKAAAEVPMGRLGAPEEFGRVAAFLLSPAASYLTGFALPVDGGLLRSL